MSEICYSDLFDILYEKVKADVEELIQDGIHASNILVLTDILMKEVGKFKITGLEKKALVMAAVKKFVADASEDAQDKTEEVIAELKELADMIDNKLDTFIDQIYDMHPEIYGKTKKHWQSFKDKMNCLGNKIKGGLAKLKCC